ncbi:MAG: hypothetical protein ABIG44_00060 [Planctomycetota bacterium]
MFQSASFSGLAVVSVTAIIILVLVAGSAALAQAPVADDKAQGAKAAQEWVKNNPAGWTTAPERPVPKDNAQPRVSPAEREKLGLPAPTWVAAHGKVQPAVREALEDQKKRIEAREPMIQFQGDRPLGFQGMAYVDLYLRHQAKGRHTSKENQASVKEVQARILSKLTAAEFSLIFAFQNTAGLVGYVNEAGLAKLVADPDVVAIGLDDQARPKDPPRAMGDEYDQGQPERRGKAEAGAYKALKGSTDGYVFVIVRVRQAVPQEAGLQEKGVANRNAQDHVLSALSPDEFKVRSRSLYRFSLSGYVNAAGLDKLNEHEGVVGVGLSRAARTLGDVKSSRFP